MTENVRRSYYHPKDFILRKLFIWLGYARILNRAQEENIINNVQWHELDARFKHYPCAYGKKEEP